MPRYIHGGAWRDPKITHQTFAPALDCLVSSGRVSSDSVAGFASIDYRLSAHPDYPQDPATTPSTALRDARHPDHLRDVQSALGFLAREYGLTDKYVLAGHSAGATLAFQLLMDPVPGVPLPRAIAGAAGIYDLASLDDRHGGSYAGFITAAFGDSRRDWDAASPAKFGGSYEQLLAPSARRIFLAASTEDTLVDKPELDSMLARLVKDSVIASVMDSLTGDHDDIWEKGSQLADVVSWALHGLP